MKNTGKYTSILLALLFSMSLARAEVPLDLEYRYDNGGSDPFNAAQVDADGNVYIAGARGSSSANSPSLSYYAVKFDSIGNELWRGVYQTGQASWYGQNSNMTIDSAGNVYQVLSESYRFGSIIKYDSAGIPQVLAQGDVVPYNWDHKVGLTIDNTGNLFVTGGPLVRKHDSAGGLLWERYFTNYTGAVRGLIPDGAGGFYATAKDHDLVDRNSATGYSIVTKQFDGNGNTLWTQRLRTGVSSPPTGFTQDSLGNLYVLSTTRDAAGELRTILLSYDSAGNERLNKVFDFGGSNQGRGLAVDDSGNIHVLSIGPVDVNGTSVTGFITAKLDSLGNEIWVRTFNDGVNAGANPYGLALDEYGNVFITGTSGAPRYNARFLTAKYNSAGDLQWSHLKYTGYVNIGMIATLKGAVYVGGQVGYRSDSVVVKYDASNTPPTANAGANRDITSDQVASTVINGTATDSDSDALSCRWLEGENLLLAADIGVSGVCDLPIATLNLAEGAHTLTLEISDGLAMATDDMTLTIANSAPNAAAGGGGVYEIGIPVVLSGEASDHDGDLLNYQWTENTSVFCSGTVYAIAGGTPVAIPDCVVADLPMGEHELRLTVTDNINQPVSSPVAVDVVDTMAPTIEPVASQYMLWPPNHAMVDVVIYANAWDNSGLPATLSAAVHSNEPESGTGTGDLAPDFAIVSIDQATGTISLQLRRERSGSGNGRIYTVVITASDDSGNQSSTQVAISVPHDKRK
jgi:hypothetical protein